MEIEENETNQLGTKYVLTEEVLKRIAERLRLLETIKKGRDEKQDRTLVIQVFRI